MEACTHASGGKVKLAWSCCALRNKAPLRWKSAAAPISASYLPAEAPGIELATATRGSYSESLKRLTAHFKGLLNSFASYCTALLKLVAPHTAVRQPKVADRSYGASAKKRRGKPLYLHNLQGEDVVKRTWEEEVSQVLLLPTQGSKGAVRSAAWYNPDKSYALGVANAEVLRSASAIHQRIAI